jgi:TadE-like protein
MQKNSIFFNQKGATIVEFAIVLFLLLTLIFGITEFGLFIFNRHVITNAAREGARAGIVARPVRRSNDEIKKVVRDYAEKRLVTFGDDVLTNDNIDIKLINNNPSDGFDPNTERCVVFEFKDAAGVFHRCDLEVTVNYTYEFLFLSNLGIGPINLRAISGMRME